MTTHSIRLVALDLDGTLLDSQGKLPAENVRLLRQVAATGVHVILATTRHYRSTRQFYDALGLTSPLICCNGAQVWASAEGPLWAEHCLDAEVARTLARLADEGQWEMATTVGEMVYCRQRPNQPLGLLNPSITIVANNVEGVIAAPLRILTWDAGAIDGLANFCRTTLAEQCSFEIYMNPDGTRESLGIFAPHANKGAALQLVMAQLGVTRDEVVTMGDNFNDLPMFACGAVSVAMANGPAAVRQQATLLAPSNAHGGVAWALRELGMV